MTTFWVIWIERNRSIFDDLEEDIIFLWKEQFLASLWASITEEFQDSSFFPIHVNGEGVLA